jgi:hypothetical protein
LGYYCGVFRKELRKTSVRIGFPAEVRTGYPRITGVSDFIHRPDFDNYKKKNKHDVSDFIHRPDFNNYKKKNKHDVSDFIHRPDFNNYKKKNKHDVSETGSVSVRTL